MRYGIVDASGNVVDAVEGDPYTPPTVGTGLRAIKDFNGLSVIGGFYDGQFHLTNPVSSAYATDHPTSGTATLNFGATPTYESSIDVTGQTQILATSKAQAWIQQDSMGAGADYNSPADHLLASDSVKLTCGTPVPGVGFTIYASSRFALWTGKFRIRWSWTL